MKIIFKMDGGFMHLPALSAPFAIDTTQIDPQVADQIQSSVLASCFFDQSARVGTVSKGAADHRTYTITVEDGPRIHTIQLTDPVTDPNLQKLVSQLRTMATHRHRNH
jgi:hypothetical protein